MPDSIREQVIDAICTAVGGEYFKPIPSAERQLPMTTVVEDEDEAVENFGSVQLAMPVLIARAEAAVGNTGAEYRKQAHDLLAAIYQELLSDPSLGGLADGITYLGGGIDAELGKVVFAQAQFTVNYHHVVGDPFTIDE